MTLTNTNHLDPASHGTEAHAGISGVNPADLKLATITVTTGEIQALNATPKTLIPAQGAGTYIVIVDVTILNDFNAAAYVVNAAGLSVRYTNGAGDVIGTLSQAFGQLAADGVAQISGVSLDGDTIAAQANAPVVLFADTADPTTGDGEFKLSVVYRVVTFA